MSYIVKEIKTAKPKVSPTPQSHLKVFTPDLPSGFKIDFVPTPLQKKGYAVLLIHPDDLEHIKKLKFSIPEESSIDGTSGTSGTSGTNGTSGINRLTNGYSHEFLADVINLYQKLNAESKYK
jgi:hypothetical protein